ncbi:MAG: FdtA/QdtA family cupin domain-containing protein [Lachnospiraceae bacterium]|nr:FdtA/QdtA family cupin domain-containing protein [Lachnospiraceae bacterium]
MKKIDDMYKIIEFDELGDERGNLVVAEGESELVPFAINRIFYIYGSDSQVVRGQHANIKTRFILINVSGTSKVKLDNGEETRIVELNKPKMGLYIDTMLWKDMYDFSPDSVLLVLASEHYDAQEYIRDYDEYLKILSDKRRTGEL